MLNLVQGLLESSRADGARTAVRQGDRVLTYAALDDASARVAALLRARGISPGDRVGVMLPNVLAFPAVYYGVLRAGGVVVPMNPLLKSREAAFYLGDSGARVVFAAADCAEEASKGAAVAGAECVRVAQGQFEQLLATVDSDPVVAAREPSDTAVVLYTSGTTGSPKGAELTHGSMTRNAEVSGRLFSVGPATSSSAGCRCSTPSVRPAASTPPYAPVRR